MSEWSPENGDVAQFHEVVRMLTRSHPKIADMLEDAKDDILAFCGFPPQHRQLYHWTVESGWVLFPALISHRWHGNRWEARK